MNLIMEQIAKDMKEGARLAVEDLSFAQVKEVILEVLDTSEDPHLLARIESSALRIRDRRTTT